MTVKQFTEDRFNPERAKHYTAVLESIFPRLKIVTGFEVSDRLISREFARAICDEFNYTCVHSEKLMKYVFSPG